MRLLDHQISRFLDFVKTIYADLSKTMATLLEPDGEGGAEDASKTPPVRFGFISLSGGFSLSFFHHMPVSALAPLLLFLCRVPKSECYPEPFSDYVSSNVLSNTKCN